MKIDNKKLNEAFNLFDTRDTYHGSDFFAKGEENDAYKIKGRKRTYIMRVLRNVIEKRTRKDLSFERRYVDYLHENGIPVPVHYETKKKNTLPMVSINDKDHFVSLQQFIKGRKAKILNYEQVKNVGILVGKMHLLTKDLKIGFDRLQLKDHLYWLSDVHELKSRQRVFVRSYALYKKSVKKIKASIVGLHKYPLHNDIHKGNLLFVGNKIVALLDFEESHKHYIPLELGWTMGEVCFSKSFEVFMGKLQYFMRGYSSQNVVSKFIIKLAFDVLVGETSRAVCKHKSLGEVSSYELQKYKLVENLVKLQEQDKE